LHHHQHNSRKKERSIPDAVGEQVETASHYAYWAERLGASSGQWPHGYFANLALLQRASAAFIRCRAAR
jgi:hypothetical protein